MFVKHPIGSRTLAATACHDNAQQAPHSTTFRKAHGMNLSKIQRMVSTTLRLPAAAVQASMSPNPPGRLELEFLPIAFN